MLAAICTLNAAIFSAGVDIPPDSGVTSPRDGREPRYVLRTSGSGGSARALLIPSDSDGSSRDLLKVQRPSLRRSFSSARSVRKFDSARSLSGSSRSLAGKTDA